MKIGDTVTLRNVNSIKKTLRGKQFTISGISPIDISVVDKKGNIFSIWESMISTVNGDEIPSQIDHSHVVGYGNEFVFFDTQGDKPVVYARFVNGTDVETFSVKDSLSVSKTIEVNVFRAYILAKDEDEYNLKRILSSIRDATPCEYISYDTFVKDMEVRYNMRFWNIPSFYGNEGIKVN